MAALSFARDIRPLFDDEDISEMKVNGGFDLSKYEDVRRLAGLIYERMADGSMPCDGPWPKVDLAKFKQWMDEGMAP